AHRRHHMNSYCWNRLRNGDSRTAVRNSHRPGRRALRPRLEGLELRELKTVTFSLSDNDLFVSGNGAADTITLDHSGTTTLINGKVFSDSLFTLIHIDTGGSPSASQPDTVNVLATPTHEVLIDGGGGRLVTNIGKAGSLQGITSLVSVTSNSI